MLREREALIQDLFEEPDYTPPPKPPIVMVQEVPDEQPIKGFFIEFLQKANDAQIELFKAVMKTPTVKTIQALLNIPFMLDMIEKEKEKEGERINKMDPREFCKWIQEQHIATFYNCLTEYNKEKIENEKKNQGIADTQ